MREILFRGKRVDNGKWAYGSLITDGEDVYVLPKENLLKGLDIGGWIDGVESYEVIPKTVGQYTGLTDKNGTRIFEGDVVTHKSYVVDVYYNNEYAGFYPFYDADSGAGYGVEAKNCEIIGNVHDNPELLGGEKNG